MTKAEKTAIIEELTEKFTNAKYFYLTDFSTLTVEETNELRAICFEKDVEMKVIKNTLIKKALERVSETQYTDLYDSLKGPTAVMFAEVGKVPAVILKEYRKGHEKPTLKAAYIDSSVYVGDEEIDGLTKVKSKEDLLGEIVTLLQSPAFNVINALKSGQNTISNLLKALEEREGGEA